MSRTVKAISKREGTAVRPDAQRATATVPRGVPDAFLAIEKMPPLPILLLSGAPASGKSAIAREICWRATKAVHLDVSTLKAMSCGEEVYGATDEAKRRMRHLARRTAAFMAVEYALDGYTVVIEDVVSESEVEDISEMLEYRYQLRKVLLDPGLESILARNRQRSAPGHDPSRERERILDAYIKLRDENTPSSNWKVLDTRSFSIQVSAQMVLDSLNA